MGESGDIRIHTVPKEPAMQTLSTKTTRTAPLSRWSLGGLLQRSLDRLVAADRAYRERQKMRRLSDDLLRDMGLTRRDATLGRR